MREAPLTWRSVSAMARAPRLSRMFSSTARYSRASSRAAGVSAGSGSAASGSGAAAAVSSASGNMEPLMASATSSTWTHRARPVPGTALPNRARLSPLTTMAVEPPGSSPTSRILATTPTEE